VTHQRKLDRTGTALALFYAGRIDEAASWAERASRGKPNWLSVRIAAVSNALGDRLDNAYQAMARLRELDPAFHVSNVKDLARHARPEDLARLKEGLRKAGLREVTGNCRRRDASGPELEMRLAAMAAFGPTRKRRPLARRVRLLRETCRADEVSGTAHFDPKLPFQASNGRDFATR
jgi:hypothetical protein